MNPRRKTCEHCGFENHSASVTCVCCSKKMTVKAFRKLPKSITPRFVKKFHEDVDKIKRDPNRTKK